VRNPVRLAEAIMREGRHVLMVGPGAEALAAQLALPLVEPLSLITPRQRALWESGRAGAPGTVGAVAVDADGHVAAATSTGGRMRKRDGRVGDSAVIGAGTYADDGGGAASATGSGEAIIREGLAKAAVDLLRAGLDPQWVATHVIRGLGARFRAEAGIILTDRFGRVGSANNTRYMITGRCSGDADQSVAE
jgi:beta-aspartyl-peptidase (threonine type)